MTAGGWVLVGLAGAAGALVRHEVTSRAADGLVALHRVNVAGAALLGLLVGALPGHDVAGALGAGGLGALTSFSTWVVGARDRDPVRHLVVPLAAAVGAAVLGTLLGRAIGGPA